MTFARYQCVKRFLFAVLALMVFSAGLVIGWIAAHYLTAIPSPTLALTIVPTSLSTKEIKMDDRFAMTLSFTNTSHRSLEFLANGYTCFQYADLKIWDANGNDHTIAKLGNLYILTSDERRIILLPDETVAGTASMDLLLNGPLQPGVYIAQAFFDYKGLHFESNRVRIVVVP
jgi:hypothetical protein